MFCVADFIIYAEFINLGISHSAHSFQLISNMVVIRRQVLPCLMGRRDCVLQVGGFSSFVPDFHLKPWRPFEVVPQTANRKFCVLSKTLGPLCSIMNARAFQRWAADKTAMCFVFSRLGLTLAGASLSRPALLLFIQLPALTTVPLVNCNRPLAAAITRGQAANVDYPFISRTQPTRGRADVYN